MNPKIAQTLYALGTVVTGIVSTVLIWGGISAESAAGITQAIAGLLTLLGGTAVTTTAGIRVTKQRADGTFDEPANPVDQVLGGLTAIADAKAQAAADYDRVTQAATDVLGQVPVLGPLAQQVIDTVRKG